MNILDLIDRLGEQEDAITKKVIVSPVLNNNIIVTRIEGIIHKLQIPNTTPGWYRFRPTDTKHAKCIGEADMGEKESYLKRMKKIRIILSHKTGPVYYGLPVKGNGQGFSEYELLPVYLPDDMAEDFMRCLCRFDGMNIWYEQVDMSADLAKTDYLTESLKAFRNPKYLKFSGLSIEEKTAYSIKYKIEKKAFDEKNKSKIQTHVEHAGGKFIESKEKTDYLSVTYEVEGQTYTSHVSKNSVHRVITAGICLTDYNTNRQGDSDYDLKNIISVIREGQEKNLIHRTM